MAYDPSPDMKESACNAHPYGCGDEPHPRPDFVGFLRVVPSPFTRAEIQALRRRAYELSSPGSPFKATQERLFGQLAETLDLLDAVMARVEEQRRPCKETKVGDADWLRKKLADELRSESWDCPSCSRRFDDDWHGRRVGPC